MARGRVAWKFCWLKDEEVGSRGRGAEGEPALDRRGAVAALPVEEVEGRGVSELIV